MQNENWTGIQKIIFRFLAAYLFLYIFPFPIYLLPFVEGLTQYYTDFCNVIAVWMGTNIFGIKETISVKMNGSGDKLIDYLLNFSVLLFALVIAVLWSILDRKRNNYNTLLDYLSIFVRYYLAMMLLSYGFAKIYKTQFPFPHLSRLLQPFGEASPMGLAWTYMGYSTSFNYFTGYGEALAGFLLFFRRTVVLGAIIGISIMGTIVMMNFSYDIPVKLFSSNLLFMLFCLLIPNAKRLLNFFILNKETAPAYMTNPIQNGVLQKVALILKYAFIAYLLYTNISGGMERVKKWGDQREKPPLYGIYTAERVIINGDTIPPLITDDNRWHQLIVDFPNRAMIKTMNGEKNWCTFKPDTLEKTIKFYFSSAVMDTAVLNYTELASDMLEIKGVLTDDMSNDTIHINLKKKDLNDFLLVKRGFNWINEFPFNR